jgi:hypothetical protein
MQAAVRPEYAILNGVILVVLDSPVDCALRSSGCMAFMNIAKLVGESSGSPICRLAIADQSVSPVTIFQSQNPILAASKARCILSSLR